MELFNETSKLATVIHKDHTLLPVISRLGVKLGFGDLTIEELCHKGSIDVTFFMEIINVFHNENYFSEKKLLDFSVTVVIDYLLKTHRYYLGYVVPEQERLIDLFILNCANGCKENELVLKFYNKFKEEFANHVQVEETKVFPYILQLNEAIQNPLKKSAFLGKYYDFAITGFEKEHGNMDEKMFDLKNIIIKYLPPNYDLNIGNSLLSNLFMFEKDLKNHARIEDKILIPKVKQLEKIIKKDE
ncbi:MAG: hemerythrin domain-containing protein [Mariniphaga sp.]